MNNQTLLEYARNAKSLNQGMTINPEIIIRFFGSPTITDEELSALRENIVSAGETVTLNSNVVKKLFSTVETLVTQDKTELTEVISDIHWKNIQAGWWNDPETGKELLGNPMVEAAKLLLSHSELSEAVEYHRKGGADNHLPEFPGLAVELADVFIRWADMVGALGLTDIMAQVIKRKREYNRARADHSRSARVATGGKKY